MKLTSLPTEFQEALPIIETLENAGYEAYFVGGSVRDTLLKKPIHDVDIATSAFPEEVKSLFKKTVDTGIEHGTVMILDHGTGYETTTFRTESTYTDFRRPDEVTFVRSLSEDLKRRDFTVNALALKGDGEVIDLFDGLKDMHNHQIRAVGEAEERFHEDALRMMRAVRFAAQLDFKIVPATLAAIKDNAHLLENIAVERINVELTKLLQGKAASYGILEMINTSLNAHMPGLRDTDIDLTGYAKLVQSKVPSSDAAAWILLTFELGLTATDAGSFLKAWKHSSALIKTAQRVMTLLNALRLGDVTDWQLYHLGADHEIAFETLELSELAFDATTLSQRYANLPIKGKQELALNGADLTKELGLHPGPLFGQILQVAEQSVVSGEQANDRQVLLALARDFTQKEKK
jgi:tRNA nucleotidyltransferase (CCA-adding enzyme)